MLSHARRATPLHVRQVDYLTLSYLTLPLHVRQVDVYPFDVTATPRAELLSVKISDLEVCTCTCT